MKIFDLFRLIRGMFDGKYSCDFFIKSFEKSYYDYEEKFPNRDPHFYLMEAWFAFMAAKGVNINDEPFQSAAYPITHLMACIHPPLCARVLGFLMLYREFPDRFEKYKFQEEFNKIAESALVAQQNGTLDQLYKKYNPNMASDKKEKKSESFNDEDDDTPFFSGEDDFLDESEQDNFNLTREMTEDDIINSVRNKMTRK